MPHDLFAQFVDCSIVLQENAVADARHSIRIGNCKPADRKNQFFCRFILTLDPETYVPGYRAVPGTGCGSRSTHTVPLLN